MEKQKPKMNKSKSIKLQKSWFIETN